jgi:hypothetical protein
MTFQNAETLPRFPWEPPPPPPSREKMIAALAENYSSEAGTREELEKMTNAELWEWYQKWVKHWYEFKVL